jgi:RimJ/RimL family protein N-acetyltransferase
VFCNQEQKYIGIAGITYMDPEKTFIEVNYTLRKPFRGKNIGETLCRACCDFAYEQGFYLIYGETLSYNRASQQILIKHGFTPDGIVKLDRTLNMKDTYLTKFVKILNGETHTQCTP